MQSYLALKEAKQLVETLSNQQFSPSQIQGYTIAEVTSGYGEIEQRWLVVESLLKRETVHNQILFFLTNKSF